MTRPESLLETRKVQNVRGDLMDEKLDRIRDAGLIVQAGFIVGFDNDDEHVFDEIFCFAQDNGLGIAVVSILSPIPSTPLHEKLVKEGRLVPEDDMVWFEPNQMSRQALKEGYRDLNIRLYSPQAFFARVFRSYARSASFRARRDAAIARETRARLPMRSMLARGLVMTWRLARALAAEQQLVAIGGCYVTAYFTHNRPFGREAMPLIEFLMLCVRHWHHFKIAHQKNSYWGRAGEVDPAVRCEARPSAGLSQSFGG